MNRFHKLLAAFGIASIALTACGGGGGGVAPHTSPNAGAPSGQGVHNVTVPPASSRTTYGTARLALTLPHVFTGRNAQAVRATRGLKPAAKLRPNARVAGRSPKYVNPVCNGECDNVIDIFVDGSLITNMDGCAGQGDSFCVNSNSADGTQNISVPLFSSDTNDIVAVEWGNNGLLAIGETWIGTFTPGTAVNASLTMQMNAAFVGILDLYNQADPEVLSGGQTYGGLTGSCGQSPQHAQFGLYSADPDGTFVPIAGYGGTSTPTLLASSPDGGGTTAAAQTTIPGVYLVNWDSHCDGVTINASAPNPAYAIYSSTTDYYGPLDGNGNDTDGYLNCYQHNGTCPGGPYQGLWNFWNRYDEPYYPQNYINQTSTVGGTADVQDVVTGQNLAYISQGASGVSIRTEAGTQVGTITTATSADVIALDDAGNTYVMTSPPRDGQGVPTGPGSISLYTSSGSGYPPAYTHSGATYTLSNPGYLAYIGASGAGELVAYENVPGVGQTLDEWDPGQTGAPSRSFNVPSYSQSQIFFFYVGHDGSVYTSNYVPCGSYACLQYNVTAPDSSTTSRTVSESIVPQSSQDGFVPNYIAVGPDGTIYVTEWAFYSADPLAGLYIYPPSSPEQFVSIGAEAPNGIDLDASGNIYVVNNNTAYDNINPSVDTADNVAVLSPGGTLLRRITGSFVEPYPISVVPDGAVFIGDFPIAYLGNSGGMFLAAAGSSTASQISSIAGGTVISWNGSVETTSRARSAQSVGHGGVSGHGGGFSPRDAANIRRRISSSRLRR